MNVSPSGQSVYITTSGPLGYSKHGSCHVGIDPGASGAARSWTLIGCTPPGNGSVTLKTRHAGKTLSLATITIDVQAAAMPTPTPTDTPTPPTPAPTPSGGLSAAKSVIDDGETVTVSAVNVSPSGQSVYITTSGPLGFAGQSPCTSGKSAAARSWSLVGCSPPGSGSVTLKTSHNGQTLSLATIAIIVQTATPPPLSKPPPPGDFKASAPIGNTGRVTLTWDRLDGADKYEVQYRLSGGAQGQSAGNWISHDDNITGPGPTIRHNVDGLTCGRSRDFRVRSHGNAALYLGDWGDQWSPILSRTPPCPPTPTPTPTVLPAPSITGHKQVAYRWLNITWTGHRDYGNRYSVQWRRQSVTGWTKWKTLPNAATAHDRSRAIIAGHTADLRGLPNSPPFNKIGVRVVGRTADGWSATSEAREIERVKPDAKGHQHDRDVNYNLSKLSTSTLSGLPANARAPGVWFREAAPRAASAWAWAAAATSTYLSVSTNSSGNAVTIRLYDETDSDDKGCRGVSETACVYFFDKPNNVDHHLHNMAMIFYPSPVYDGRFYKWTNDKSRNMKRTHDRKRRYLWVEGALIHEFGHTFGLKHPAEDADLTGIMHTPNVMLPSKKYENGLTTIQPVDVAAIKFIYHGHIKNEGW